MPKLQDNPILSNQNKMLALFALIFIFIALSFGQIAADPSKIGIVSLHPKWSMPAKIEGWFKDIGKHELFKNKFQRKCGMGPWRCSADKTIVGHENNDLRLIDFALHKKGFLIESPHCAWSKRRLYDLPVDEALKQCITPRIERLKKRGAEKIVILGKSLGANMAIRAGVIFNDLSGIIAMAPGHTPNSEYSMDLFTDDVARAKEMISEGKGDQTFDFIDLNQGETITVNSRAAGYFSMFDPNGKAVMIENTAKLKKTLPFLWIVGDQDIITTRHIGPDIFKNAPKNPKSKYIEVSGGHDDVGENGQNDIINWLESLLD